MSLTCASCAFRGAQDQTSSTAVETYVGPTWAQAARGGLPDRLPALQSWLPGRVVIPLCRFVIHPLRLHASSSSSSSSSNFRPPIPPSIILLLLLCMAATCSSRHTQFPAPPECLLHAGVTCDWWEALDRPWPAKGHTEGWGGVDVAAVLL